MSQKYPDSLIKDEIADINREFLRLLTHPRLPAMAGVLGLDGPTLDSLRRLDAAQLENIAGSSLLLAEFNPLPGTDDFSMRADQMVADAAICPDWQQDMSGFANRLLTFVWQASRRDRLLSAFCLGLDKGQAQRLAQLSFIRISRGAEYASVCLRARLSQHPKFWHDLVRTAHSGNRDQQLAAQLALIQLSVVRQWTPGKGTSAPRYF